MSLFSRITGIFKRSEPPKGEDTSRGSAYNKPRAMLGFEFLGQQHDIRTKISEIEALDQTNGQVKQLHIKLAKFATRGGVRFVMKEGAENDRMSDIAGEWIKRTELDKRKVRSQHARRLLKHGNLVLQNVASKANRIEKLIVMPTEMMRPELNDKGQIADPSKAYSQTDWAGMNPLCTFAKWQISWGDLDRDPDKLYGRPLIDAERKRAAQITMTDDDLVIRRRVRATLRLLHVLEGAREEEIEEYKKRNKDSLENPLKIDSDLYSNKPGSVTVIQGDANLDQIKDVKLLNDKFYAGAGVTGHQFGLAEADLNRDVYEDTLADLFETIEEIQETVCDTWEESLRIEFLLQGINADAYQWDLKLEGRKVETPTQKYDRALKAQALGLPMQFIVTEILTLPWEKIHEMMETEREEMDPYGGLFAGEIAEGGKPKFKIVEGNAPKKDSATYVGNK